MLAEQRARAILQQLSQHQPQCAAHGREHRVFPKHIGGSLIPVKAQHFDGGNLPDTLCDIDVVQIVEYDEGQRSGAADHHKYDIVHTAHHAGKAHQHICIDLHGGHMLQIHQCGAHLVYIRFLRQIHIEIFKSKGARPHTHN